MTLSPISLAPPQQILATVVATQMVAPRHHLVSLQAPSIARSAYAGQFVHVLPRDPLLFDPLLRRAFSIMAARPRQGEIDILFRVEGSGTAQIAARNVGESLDLIGPLGQPFDLRLFHVKQEGGEQNLTPILVGGGVGVPPLIFLGKTLKSVELEPLMLIGARGADELLGLAALKQMGIETRIATDDGSVGHAGRVTDLLEVALQRESHAVIYACGPLPMLRAVAAVAELFQVPCQVSLEENMPCGIGVCNGCVVAVKAKEAGENAAAASGDFSDYGRYQRVCVVGPALWASDIDWEAR